jgi:hypothetical protein
LGVWVSADNNKNFIKQQISHEINITSMLLKKKCITSQQIAYIINAVTLPRIEYKANLTFLSESDCDKLTTPLCRLIRHKSGISNTTPNAILYDKLIFDLTGI